jgi:hypothetical protein
MRVDIDFDKPTLIPPRIAAFFLSQQQIQFIAPDNLAPRFTCVSFDCSKIIVDML